MQVYDYGVLGPSKLLCESQLDLSFHLNRARQKAKNNMALVVPPYWVKLTSMEQTKKSPELELSLTVVSDAMAAAKPVGKGGSRLSCQRRPRRT